MTDNKNMWIFVMVALIVGGAVGYASAGGFTAGGKAIATGCKSCVNLQQGQILTYNDKKISLYDVTTKTGDTCAVSVDGTLAWIPVFGNQQVNGVSVVVNSAAAKLKSCDICVK